MEEEKIEEQKFTDVATIKLDFDSMAKWRKPDSDDLPICSFLSLYEACGMEPIIKKYYEENNSKQIVAIENLLCNFYTLQRMKNFVEDNWKTYSLDIDNNNHVFWDPNSKYGKKKHYAKKLKAAVKASVITDFANFCPGIDDELPDDILVFRIYKEENNESTSGN